MQHARERLYLTAAKDRLVREGDPKAAFLYAAQGDEIPQSAADKFGLVDGRLRPARAPKGEGLLGSSVLPSIVVIGADKSVQLGEVVAAAHKASGLSVEAWNQLPAEQREDLLKMTVEAMQAQPPAAAAKKAAAPKKPKAAQGPGKEKPAPATKEQAPPANKERPAPENKGQ